MSRHPNFSVGDIDLGVTAVAFSACEMVAERLMRSSFEGEVAQIIAEDNEHSRRLIRASHNSYRDARILADMELKADMLPFRHIQNGVLFAAKNESPALQVADMCAFFIRAHLRKQKHAEPYFQKLKPWMAVLPKGEEEYVPPIRERYPLGPLVVVYGEPAS